MTEQLVRRPFTLTDFDPVPELALANTPPPDWYLDHEFHDWERSVVFERSWLPLARRDQVIRPGEYIAGQTAGNPYLIVRGDDGVLRGFHNVCRHHAAEVLRGTGHCRELRCGYHGWTYRLDGSLRRTPGFDGGGDFDPAAYGLVPIAVEEWGPLVFGFLAEGAPARSVAEELAPVGDVLAGTERLRWVERREYPMRCNWKVFVENSLDGGYHVPYVHRSLAKGLVLRDFDTTIHERTALQQCAARGDERLGEQVSYAWLFPNLFLNRYGNVLDTNVVLPVAPDRCVVIFDWFVDGGDEPDELDDGWVKRAIDESDLIQQQDVLACESVQRGLGSSAVRRGRYGSPETAVQAFHRILVGLGG